MSCESPLLAIDLGINPQTDKHLIKLVSKWRVDVNLKVLEEKYGLDSVLCLPCGVCAACRLEHRKMWSLRCQLEAKYHKKNCFVTLTYSDFFLPKQPSKNDFRGFIKALRNRGYNVRYFGCGEYGSDTLRPHLHIVLFGYFPDDAVVYAKSKSGNYTFKSKELNSLWAKGIVDVEEFGPGTAAYTAGYVDKKLHQEFKGEFILMSTHPGIGYQYFEDHKDDIVKYGNVVSDRGVIAPIPRYFEKLIDVQGLDDEEIKKAKKEAMRLFSNAKLQVHSFENREQLFKYEGRKFKDKLNKKKRGL